ncbi:unannotated protein [freshwater metagenome]|uniref:Unannotated protein n=1 Tax=freshwater metagenome TaxID=449393 RepID=A0A6J6FMY8_9ZZZZ
MITLPIERWIRPPMTNKGIITSMPTRMVNLSASQPIIGRTARPGMIHNEATEYPVARARGGMANDRPVKMAGASIARAAEITQFTATAT